MACLVSGSSLARSLLQDCVEAGLAFHQTRGRVPIVVLQVDIGAMPQKKLRNLRMAPSDSIMKRRRTNTALEVDFFTNEIKSSTALRSPSIAAMCNGVSPSIPGFSGPLTSQPSNIANCLKAGRAASNHLSHSFTTLALITTKLPPPM